jgi:polar amino acid transport system permease protein
MGALQAGASAPPHRTVVVPVRHYGRWLLGVIVAVIAAAIVYAFARADIDWRMVGSYLGADLIITGMLHTLELTVLSMAMALVLGTCAAVMRQSQNPVLNVVSWFYAWLFRGTPLLVQLLIWYNLSIVFKTVTIPGIFTVQTNQLMTPFVASLLGLGVNEGAYISEIIRGGILAVGKGQTEAALAIGMTRGKLMRRIVLPQALRVIVPPLGNEFISLLKYSSLAFTISYFELLDAATRIYTANFRVIELLFTASIWYLVLTTVFTGFQIVLERRLGKGRGQGSILGQLQRNLSLRRVQVVR